MVALGCKRDIPITMSLLPYEDAQQTSVFWHSTVVQMHNLALAPHPSHDSKRIEWAKHGEFGAP